MLIICDQNSRHGHEKELFYLGDRRERRITFFSLVQFLQDKIISIQITDSHVAHEISNSQHGQIPVCGYSNPKARAMKDKTDLAAKLKGHKKKPTGKKRMIVNIHREKNTWK